MHDLYRRPRLIGDDQMLDRDIGDDRMPDKEARSKRKQIWEDRMKEAGIEVCSNCGYPIHTNKTRTCQNCGHCEGCG